MRHPLPLCGLKPGARAPMAAAVVLCPFGEGGGRPVGQGEEKVVIAVDIAGNQKKSKKSLKKFAVVKKSSTFASPERNTTG